MKDYGKLLKELRKQEETLQFNEFNSETALEIGMSLTQRAKEQNKSITIDIRRNGHQLFHYALDGTSPDNDEWIIRKNNVVNRFHTSSLYVGTKLKMEGKMIEEKYHISSKEYSAYGGAFPIILKKVGVVGSITVSGLKQEEDHKFVVKSIEEYLSRHV
ncbi:heme-degrading domain-containing protein [Wukongibacter sp. M2B1]|uniref:heme-degrading domain-containing protein n=1 Tax=Wukongibacter sp. M2B1 TaxID=3088895 RepID=UPI003D7927A1